MAQSDTRTYSLTARHAARGGLVACGVALAACSSILGIEDLHDEPRDSAKGGSGQAGSATGAMGGKAGGTSSGGKAGAAGGRAGAGGGSGTAGAAAGSSSGGTAGAGVGGNGGSGGSVGGSAGSGGSVGGSGGEAGSPEPMTGPVSGTIIDFWRHPIAGVPVQIGDGTATTDQDGKFTIADVAETYDAAFIVTTPDPDKVHEWVFMGLSRRDPTLQVTEGVIEHEAHFYVTQANGGTFDSGYWYLAIGSANGSRASTASSTGFDVRPNWYGPAENDWTLHSLFMDKTAELPTGYVAYETKTATSDAGNATMQQDFEMDLTTNPDLDTGMVSGAIVESSGEGRTNSAFVRFATGAALPIVDRVDASAQSYQYLVPVLPNGSITIAAAEAHDDGSYAIAHTDGHNQGQSGLDIEIPPTASGLLPGNDTENVASDAPFSFNPGDPDNSGYLVHIEAQFSNDGVFIVTTNRQFTLDDIPLVNGMRKITADTWYLWNVETHGQFDSVDDMAEAGGFLDAFALGGSNLPQGPSTTDGAFTTSYYTYFKTAP